VGFRFRRSVKIAPGIRLNFSGSGVSTTLGGRGASVNLSDRGSRATASIPGSGISYSTRLSGGGRRAHTPRGTQANSGGCGALAAVGGLVLLIGMCSSQSQEAPSTPASGANLQSGELTYVDSRSVNCRAEPSKQGTVKASLSRGQSATVIDRSGDWTKVSDMGQECWVSSSLLSAFPPIAAGAASGAAAQSLVSSRSSASSDYGASGSSSRSSARKARRSSKARRSRSSGGYSGSSCPCSGSNICVGPRGGRYCITSGGNKRYGV
jgi:hypothetical protein